MSNYDFLESLDETKPLVNMVKDSLENAIFKCKFKPGDRLVEEDLSKTLKISRGPIREAFRLLEKDGYIKIYPRKGALVKAISFGDICEIYQVRGVLEGLAAKLFSHSAEDKEISRLKSVYEKMEVTLKDKNIDNYKKLNKEFHNIYVKGCNNSRIRKQSNVYLKQITWFQNITLSSLHRPDNSKAEHGRILEAFLKRNPEEAELAAKEHIENSMDYYIERWSHLDSNA
ncbi:GntR family transcriptional regulator [Thermodesulfobacteriota bacterium]